MWCGEREVSCHAYVYRVITYPLVRVSFVVIPDTYILSPPHTSWIATLGSAISLPLSRSKPLVHHTTTSSRNQACGERTGQAAQALDNCRRFCAARPLIGPSRDRLPLSWTRERLPDATIHASKPCDCALIWRTRFQYTEVSPS